MGFGMKDVEQRILQLLTKLRSEANLAFTEMTANIINELLTDKINNYIGKDNRELSKKVDVIIKRIGEDKFLNVEKLKEQYSDNFSHNEKTHNEFLTYYLQKLAEIYDKQEAIDKKLSKFASVCSKYMSGKRIEYNETLLTMDVFDEDGNKVRLNDLSSGEKQIVSIFSKVYLDVTSPCIFIIDEPEISLSIEWQKEFLKDIYKSGKIALLIATTHSPFIFKNEYSKYVKDLNLFKE